MSGKIMNDDIKLLFFGDDYNIVKLSVVYNTYNLPEIEVTDHTVGIFSGSRHCNMRARYHPDDLDAALMKFVLRSQQLGMLKCFKVDVTRSCIREDEIHEKSKSR